VGCRPPAARTAGADRHGSERALGVVPFTEIAAIREAIESTRQARTALAEVGPPPLTPLTFVPSSIEPGFPGSVLDGIDLVMVIPFLEAAPRLARTPGHGPNGTAVVAMGQALPRVDVLRDALRAALDDEGAVKTTRVPVFATCAATCASGGAASWPTSSVCFRGAMPTGSLPTGFVTVRHGRYVVPVRAEARQRLRGSCMTRSQSGQTLFVEPESAVDANNDLVQLTREEEQENGAHPGRLSDAVRARLDDLDRLVASSHAR